MARISGVSVQKNAKGDITSVTIDMKKHKEIMTPVLEKLGVVENTQFEKDYERGLTVAESRKRSLDFVKSLEWVK